MTWYPTRPFCPPLVGWNKIWTPTCLDLLSNYKMCQQFVRKPKAMWCMYFVWRDTTHIQIIDTQIPPKSWYCARCALYSKWNGITCCLWEAKLIATASTSSNLARYNMSHKFLVTCPLLNCYLYWISWVCLLLAFCLSSHMQQYWWF